MALWKFSNLNKYGNIRTRIVHLEDGKPFSYNPKGFGPFVEVHRFKYEHHHLYAPVLFVDSNNQKFILLTKDLEELIKTLLRNYFLFIRVKNMAISL